MLGRKLEDKYIIDILLIPKQNGYTGYFETINEYEIHNSYVVPSYGWGRLPIYHNLYG